MDALKLIEQGSMKAEAPVVEVGDLVKVHVKIKEGEKFRIQIFEGIERVFPLHSPTVEKVELVRNGKVRRAKLYYLRDRVGKAAKVKSKV